MSKKADLTEWWTPQRIEDEEAVWQRDRFFVDYANDVRAFMHKHHLLTVIEIGCGAGHVGEQLRAEKFRYIGTDGSPMMVEFARNKYPHIMFETLNIRDMNEESQFEGLDLVCSFAVFKHFRLEDWQMAIKNILSVAKYGMVQVQIRQEEYPSVEDDFFGPVPHNWINVGELSTYVNGLGHDILELRLSDKDMSPYMDHGAEALLITKNRLAEKI